MTPRWLLPQLLLRSKAFLAPNNQKTNMKRDIRRNLLVLTGCLLCTILLGGYVTYVRQPVELERVKKAEQLLRLKNAEVSSLLLEVNSSREKADEAYRKWQGRYKIMPKTLTSAEVVGYLNSLTQEGFENFDVTLVGVENKPDYGTYTFNVQGRAYYASLYRFVWDIENNRNFYRARDLALSHIDLITQDGDKERMQVMVSFSMNIDAYFGGPDGMSAPLEVAAVQGDSAAARSGNPLLPPVPMDVLPSQRPAINPFFPIVMEQLPPNTYGLVDVESATLVSISGGEAVFKDEKGYRKLGIGDAVYLGQITSIDPRGERVVARLNKGGIIDEVEIELQTGERFRQALGPLQLAPSLQ